METRVEVTITDRKDLNSLRYKVIALELKDDAVVKVLADGSYKDKNIAERDYVRLRFRYSV